MVAEDAGGGRARALPIAGARARCPLRRRRRSEAGAAQALHRARVVLEWSVLEHTASGALRLLDRCRVALDNCRGRAAGTPPLHVTPNPPPPVLSGHAASFTPY